MDVLVNDAQIIPALSPWGHAAAAAPVGGDDGAHRAWQAMPDPAGQAACGDVASPALRRGAERVLPMPSAEGPDPIGSAAHLPPEAAPRIRAWRDS
ncbi:MAG: hypothetical protein ACOYOH_16250 [Paracraurococcus sp.]